MAAETIAGAETRPIDYQAMPRCTYCQPQVASFGLSEAQAVELGYKVKTGKFFFLANGKALGLGERDGFVKIVADEVSGEILGAHLVGPEVTELLPEVVLARTWEFTPEEIAHSVHAHPTLSEVIAEASLGVFGKPIHAWRNSAGDVRSAFRELLDETPPVLQALPAGGAGWTDHQALFARAGFTEAGQADARAHDVTLVDLARLDEDL